jgi:hypothetical protein
MIAASLSGGGAGLGVFFFCASGPSATSTTRRTSVNLRVIASSLGDSSVQDQSSPPLRRKVPGDRAAIKNGLWYN